ncbi:MAG: diacylglycerol kinase family protein [Anaerolineales bacterium]
MPAKVILNPYSNRWNAQARWPQAAAALKDAGVDFELSVSDYRGHAVELTAQAVREGFSPIIAAGGDGTVGDVVNGLAQAARDGQFTTLGVMPLGTANDLMCNLGQPLDLPAAARVIADGRTRLLDVCQAGERYFINNSGMGLEPHITHIQQGITWIKGVPRYLVAALQGIFENPRWQGVVEWDAGRYEGPLSLVSVGNGARTGGLFFLTPHADPSDGKLTVVIGYKRSPLALLGLLPQTMSPEGRFLRDPDIREFHADWLKITLDHPS